MSRAFLGLLLPFLAGAIPVFGDAQVVQKFDGVDSNVSTATFTVQDKWEVLCFSPHPIDITILNPDGSVVAGFKGGFKGSFYQPKGGTYYFQINSDHPEIKVPWHLVVANVAAGTTFGPGQGDGMLANGADPNYTPPSTIIPPGGFAQVAGLNSQANAGPGSSGNPFGSPTPPAPAAPATPAPTVKLTEDQTRAVVLIKGDNSEGTGFLIKTPDGPAIVTNIHVIAANPNLKITTNSGAFVKVLSEKGASDRDLALLSIQDAGYSYMEIATDISKVVQTGDEVITPGNSQGGEVMLNTAGKVLGIGPERIEFDNPIYHGNSGGPVFHTKSNKVLGVVTEAMKVDMSNDLDKASFASRNSAISGSMRYFALRLDTVTAWVPIESRTFQIETTFLDEFHDQSRRLDAFLNRPQNTPRYPGMASSEDDASKIYLTDAKIMKANSNFLQRASGGDTAQRIQALRGFLFDLQCVADTNMTQIQAPSNFYSFDQGRAREELDYRKALKEELAAIGNNIERLGTLPRTNN